ncbi:hypothetical protein ThidrDRAFT_0982 [Thiorhodococcus drewsii AZ1]|uniref:Type 4 fimbrial biogenesis protein PilX N-terminal domain-containing protein n=1 Tax=Thiorhodococcus drewsii AZ1 TaxID=765913 RepID=G2DY70_9GAMM|nr:PilX N-terminal domain-containing pilus assembly protein [Thiorhodococcus drewsii]EGV32862.1 hypothetical protein ThidrDRAFT_0982 [Thiorhodococcus drewsii AZ1]
MKTERPNPPHTAHRHQRGAATLFVGLLLLIGAGILTFSASRTGVIEQRIANNEIRSTEAQLAAEAGLEFAQAWLSSNAWTEGTAEPTPPSLTTASGYRFETDLTFDIDPRGLCVHAASIAASDANISAHVQACYQQQGLFDASPSRRMPPPLVSAECLDAPTMGSELFIRESAKTGAASGQSATASCLPQGDLTITNWLDANGNRVMEITETGTSASFERAAFKGCPSDHCAWNQIFAMPLDQAIERATQSNHLYGDTFPCGAPPSPGIYVKTNDSDIGPLDMTGTCIGIDGVDNRTIGAPSTPVLILVPSSSGCPAFSPDIGIYGILYYETTSDCATRGWGGATIHGAVVWEGSAAAPSSGSRFIATDYGAGSGLNRAYQVVTQATRIPGTWRDWD